MNKTKSILGVAALAAVSWVAVNGISITSEAQGSAKTLTAQDLLDIRQLIDGYAHLLDHCTNNRRASHNRHGSFTEPSRRRSCLDTLSLAVAALIFGHEQV